jgi:hypothetical protein
MVSTRSANKQTHLEDFKEDKPASKPRAKQPTKAKGATKQAKISTSEDGGMLSPPPSPSRKRKTPPADKKQPAKKAKSEVKTEDEHDVEDDPVIINRAPVLHLWGACVTQFLYPKLEWSTCLSAGNAISAICAVAKGRAIGAIDEPEDTEGHRKKKEEQKKKASELDELEVMQFKLKQKDGKIVFSGKPQSNDDGGLRKKYGERYDEVKKAFDDALATWKGSEEELSKAGFGMYEDFRPNVSKGQKGWGRKGALDLDVVRKTITKE